MTEKKSRNQDCREIGETKLTLEHQKKRQMNKDISNY